MFCGPDFEWDSTIPANKYSRQRVSIPLAWKLEKWRVIEDQPRSRELAPCSTKV